MAEEKKEKSLWDNIKGGYNNMIEGDDPRETRSNERALLAGATPLLVGLLTGNLSDGVDVAAKGLMAEDERKLKEDNTLLDYLRKKEEKKEMVDKPIKRYQSVAVDTDNGVELRRFDTITGEYSSPKDSLLKGYRKGVIKDPRTGELVTSSGATGKATPTEIAPIKEDRLTARQEDKIDKIQKDFRSETKQNRDAVEMSESAISMIESDNPIAHEAAIFRIARAVQGGGVLTEQDVSKMGGSKAISERLNQIKKKAQDGTLTANNKKYLLEIANMMRSNAMRNIESRAKEVGKTKKKIVGTDVKEFLIPENNNGDQIDSSDDLSKLSPVDIEYRMQENQRRIEQLKKELGRE